MRPRHAVTTVRASSTTTHYYRALVAISGGDASAALTRAVALGFPRQLVRAAPEFEMAATRIKIDVERNALICGANGGNAYLAPGARVKWVSARTARQDRRPPRRPPPGNLA